MNIRYYTGVGARETPKDILGEMMDISEILSNSGYILRSGKAEGADAAFQLGVQKTSFINGQGKAEIYLPWEGFTGDDRLWGTWDIYPHLWQASVIAEQFHPRWHKLGYKGKQYMARNSHQVLGKDLNTPSDFVLYWAEEDEDGVKGGTGQAIRIARHYGIPDVNMYHYCWKEKLQQILKRGVNNE